jgi:hypothetical protein
MYGVYEADRARIVCQTLSTLQCTYLHMQQEHTLACMCNSWVCHSVVTQPLYKHIPSANLACTLHALITPTACCSKLQTSMHCIHMRRLGSINLAVLYLQFTVPSRVSLRIASGPTFSSSRNFLVGAPVKRTGKAPVSRTVSPCSSSRGDVWGRSGLWMCRPCETNTLEYAYRYAYIHCVITYC